jgi:hypothetical protein
LVRLEAFRVAPRRIGGEPETPGKTFVYALCQECVVDCIGADRKRRRDAGLHRYTFDTKAVVVGSKGVVKSKSPPQKRSSKVKAPFGFTRNRYRDVFILSSSRWTKRTIVGRSRTRWNRGPGRPVEAFLGVGTDKQPFELLKRLYVTFRGVV